jgi:hypothetical protein
VDPADDHLEDLLTHSVGTEIGASSRPPPQPGSASFGTLCVAVARLQRLRRALAWALEQVPTDAPRHSGLGGWTPRELLAYQAQLTEARQALLTVGAEEPGVPLGVLAEAGQAIEIGGGTGIAGERVFVGDRVKVSPVDGLVYRERP